MTLLTLILATVLQIAPLPSHPRLFLLEGEEKALMRNVGSDGRWSRVHDAIVQEAERIAEAPSMDFNVDVVRNLLPIPEEKDFSKLQFNDLQR